MGTGGAILSVLSWLATAVVYALAVARVVRLINADNITDWLRLWPATKSKAARDAALSARSKGELQTAAIY